MQVRNSGKMGQLGLLRFWGGSANIPLSKYNICFIGKEDSLSSPKTIEKWWNNILETEPAPFVPQPHNETDTAYFDTRNNMQQWKVSQFRENSV